MFIEAKDDIKQELEKIGAIVRIRFFDTHPDGIVEVKFKEEKEASECITIMDGRFYDSREIECFYWDGETDYKTHREAKEVEEKRIEKFGEWLEEGDPDNKEQLLDHEEAKEIKLSL